MLYSSLIKNQTFHQLHIVLMQQGLARWSLNRLKGQDCTSTSKPWPSNVSPPAKDIHASYIPPKDGFHNRRQFKRWQYSIGVTIYYVENLIKDIKESESCLRMHFPLHADKYNILYKRKNSLVIISIFLSHLCNILLVAQKNHYIRTLSIRLE